ncbi:hypothetical protein V8F20_000819 [Naviculisporaceae sp. PSN 640]
MTAAMELDTILNKDEPPSRCDHRMFLRNILNEEPVEQRRKSLPSRPRQPSQTAPFHLRADVRSRSQRIEPRMGESWAIHGIDKILVQQVPTSRSKRAMKNMGWERPAKKRGSFTEAKRKATENTRRNKACFRCRNQAIRCEADSDDPKAWCVPCKNLWSNTNKKIIHKLPCLRVKITASVLFRSSLRGGTTPPPKRWEMSSEPNGAKGGKQTIEITFGLCDEPIVLRIPQHNPSGNDHPEIKSEGDVSPNMPHFSPAYHIADTEWLGSYFERHAFEQRTLDLALQDAHPLIRETYRQALLHCERLNTSALANKRKHLLLMRNLFKLWFAMRHLVGSSWICDGGASEIGQGAVASERTLTPAHITAQFEVNLLHALTPLRTNVLQQLETMLGRNKSEDWYTVYLAVFILLHEVSVATKDQKDGDNAKPSHARYSSPEFVQNLHEGANTLILHWHYWRRKANPLEIPDHHNSSLKDLTDAEFEFVKRSYETMQVIPSGTERLPVEDTWEHELFWISQMFEYEWSRFVGLAAPLMERRKSLGSLSETASTSATGSPCSSPSTATAGRSP